MLGGGGLKGLAHVGAWRALTEAGVHPAGIVGTSMGALVGAPAPSGMTWKEMRAVSGCSGFSQRARSGPRLSRRSRPRCALRTQTRGIRLRQE
ncbi:MAG: patatin-like phospholipase family protein [Gemmatimonadota bacterium]|nr:patatin-like phospholipase family protein [Gemmatimonadota bacterium]